MKLTREKAMELLREAEGMNPGPWVPHSISVAEVAQRLAEALKVDVEKTYIGALLHDIGRRYGYTGTRHILDGYNYLCDLGYDDIARYCLTHSYFIKDAKIMYGKRDMTDSELEFVQKYLDGIEYDIYDKLVQLADCMAIPQGAVSLERRLLEVNLRHGIPDFTLEDWKAKVKLQHEIETLLGHSIYKVLTEVGQELENCMIEDVFVF